MFNAFVVTGMQFFGGVVLEYSSYLDAVMSQFEFLLGKAVPMDALRRDKPLIGPTFAFFFLYIHSYISYEYSDFYPQRIIR